MSAAFGAVISFFYSRFSGRSDRGATAVEYGLLVAGIAVAIIATVVLIGPRLDGLFQEVLTKLPGGGTEAG